MHKLATSILIGSCLLSATALGVAATTLIAHSPGQSVSIRLDDSSPATAGDSRYLLIDDVNYALQTPCPTEDSPDCYWDAQAMGNGAGSSTLNIRGNIMPLTILNGK